MKTTKKVIIALAVATLVAPTLESCKKGENDPGLSLRSRKARVAGEWTVSKYDYKESRTGSMTQTFSSPSVTYTSSYIINETVTFDGTNFNHIEKSSNTYNNVTTSYDTTYSGTGEIKYTFEKDGTFTKTMTSKYTRTRVTTPYTGATQTNTWTQETTTTTTGTWNFTAGIGKDSKNKDGLVFTFVSTETKTTINDKTDVTFNSTTTTTTTVTTSTDKITYDSNEINENWYLDRLANKEMVAKVTGKTTETNNSTSTTTSPSGTSTSTEVGNSTGTYSADITLTQE